MVSADLQHSASAAVTGGIFLAICFILRRRGPYVVATTCLFVASLVSTQILMSRLSSFYKHPGAVTTLHFFCVWLTCCAYWQFADATKAPALSEARTNEWFLRNILPLALSNPLTVVFNNTALVYAGAGVCAILGTLSPVSVALLSYAFGRNLTWTSWTGIWLAFCGALVIAAGEVKSIRATAAPQQTLIGILFALASVGTRSLKIVVMDFLLAPREYVSELSPLKETPLSPMQLYSLQAPWCVLAAFVFAVCTDSFQRAVAELNRDAAFLITLTCVSAVSLNFLGLLALKELGASSQQIIGKLNTICVGAISVGYLNEKLSMTVICGSAIVLSGAALVELGKEGKTPEPSSKV